MTRSFVATNLRAIVWLILSIGTANAQFNCPPMPDKVTQINHDVKVDVDVGVGSLGKLKAGQVGVKTDVVAKNLFDKYPNTDRVVIAQMMSATYCEMIRDSKTLKDSEKLRLWNEFSDRVFKFANPDYKPAPASPKQTSEKSKGRNHSDDNKQASSSPGDSGQKAPAVTLNSSPGGAASIGQQGGTTAPVQRPSAVEIPAGTTITAITNAPDSAAVGVNTGTVTVNPPVNPNKAIVTYDFHGLKRTMSPGSMLGDTSAYDVFVEFEKKSHAHDWRGLAASAEDQKQQRPEWLTPYFAAAEAYSQLCDKNKAIENLEYFVEKAEGSPDYAAIFTNAKQNLQTFKDNRWPPQCMAVDGTKH